MTTPKLLNALRAQVRAKYEKFLAAPYFGDTGSATPPSTQIWQAADSGYIGNAPTHLATLVASHVAANGKTPAMQAMYVELRAMAAPVSGAIILDTGTGN